MKHSPLPWRVNRSESIYSPDDAWILSAKGTGFIDDGGMNIADARFIVRACNHFEEMRDYIRVVSSVDCKTCPDSHMCDKCNLGILLAKLEAAE